MLTRLGVEAVGVVLSGGGSSGGGSAWGVGRVEKWGEWRIRPISE